MVVTKELVIDTAVRTNDLALDIVAVELTEADIVLRRASILDIVLVVVTVAVNVLE
jgi:hypothetical protein